MRRHVIAIVMLVAIFSSSLTQAALFRSGGMAIDEVRNAAASFIKARKNVSHIKDFRAYKKAMKTYKKSVISYLSKNESAFDNLREVIEREMKSKKAIKKLDEWEKKNKSSMASVKKEAREFISAYKKLEHMKEYRIFRDAKKLFRATVLEYVDQNGNKAWNVLLRDKPLKEIGKKIIRKIEEWRKKS